MSEAGENKPLSSAETKWRLGELLAVPFALLGGRVIRWIGNLGAASIFLLLSLTMIFGAGMNSAYGYPLKGSSNSGDRGLDSGSFVLGEAESRGRFVLGKRERRLQESCRPF